MRFPWRQVDSAGTTAGAPGTVSTVPGVQTCRGLARALGTVATLDKAEVLDLGPVCGDTVVYLAGRGARVTVESFEPPPPTEVDDDRPPPPIEIPHPDGAFHVVLGWEWLDFVPPGRLSDFSREIHRVLVPGGKALFFSLNDTKVSRGGSPSIYRIIADDRVVREYSQGTTRRRWVHQTRDLEHGLAPLTIDGVQLQRNQMREILAGRKRR